MKPKRRLAVGIVFVALVYGFISSAKDAMNHADDYCRTKGLAAVMDVAGNYWCAIERVP